jgi:hypothetical protein
MRYEFIQLASFRSDAKRLGFTLDDLATIENAVSKKALDYPVIAGTGGVRKMRFSSETSSGGKSGGSRVCYFVVVDPAHVYLVMAFGKNEKENLSPQDRNAIASVVEFIRKSYRDE